MPQFTISELHLLRLKCREAADVLGDLQEKAEEGEVAPIADTYRASMLVTDMLVLLQKRSLTYPRSQPGYDSAMVSILKGFRMRDTAWPAGWAVACVGWPAQTCDDGYPVCCVLNPAGIIPADEDIPELVQAAMATSYRDVPQWEVALTHHGVGAR